MIMISKLRKIIQHIKKLYYTHNIKKTCKSFRTPLYVNGQSYVSHKTTLGKNVNFNGMKISGCGEVKIGDNFHSGQECKIITQIHNYEGTKIPYDETYICKEVVIEDNVWIGDRVMILGNVHIGEGSIIQAGSVVVTNIPKYSIAGGHPAKVFKKRDIEHYQELKKEKKFH